MEDFKNKIEALLFSSGKKMSLEEISKFTRIPSDKVLEKLKELKADYDAKNNSLLLSEEDDGWKLTVREQYAAVVRRIVAETELTRSVIETLAVIAWKAPVLQSEVIKVRTNKAYDHLSELENSGYISRAKHGRTKIIKLTDRFFSYFDLKNSEQMKEKFKVEEPQQQTPIEEQPTSVAEDSVPKDDNSDATKDKL